MTIADLIVATGRAPHEDRAEHGARLCRALSRVGPVLWGGWIYSGTVNGSDWRLFIDSDRAIRQFATVVLSDGSCKIDRSRIPGDAYLSGLWGIRLATKVEVPIDVA